jgi:hypothetical protein
MTRLFRARACLLAACTLATAIAVACSDVLPSRILAPESPSLSLAPNAALSVPPVGADPLTCTGYPEPRVFLESQAWWDSLGLSLPDRAGSQIQLGTCFPTDSNGGSAIVTQAITLDVRLTLRNSTGATNWIRWQTEETTRQQKALLIPPSRDTTVWTTLTIDPATLPTGRREIRISLNIPRTESGHRQYTATAWQLCIRVCSPSYRSGNYTEAFGYYTGHDLQHARFQSPLPIKPKSGLWTFGVRLVESGVGGVFVDPDFQAGIEGLKLRAGGPFNGNVTIDTRLLVDGEHRLWLVSSDGKSAGVQVVTFTVANSTVPAPVASVMVNPASATLVLGQQIQLGATLRDSVGNVLPAHPVTWASSDAPGDVGKLRSSRCNG